ncbi:MAG: glycosyltransferase family A protein [Ignavibacteriota bacterium]
MNDDLNNQPLVSIIIPCYNCEEFIEETLKSVLNQSYQNFEVIIVDDCSTDNTLKLVQQYSDSDQRIKVYTIEHAGRPSVPRNFGVSKSSGEFIAFLDSDDLWTKEKLKYQVNYLKDNSGISFIYSMSFTFGNVNIFSEMLELLPLPFRAVKNRDGLLHTGNTIPLSSVLIRKKTLIDAGGFDEDPHDKLEDFGLWLDISKANNFHFIPRVHVYYRIHKNQFSSDWKSKEESLKYLAKKKNINLNTYKYFRRKSIIFLFIRNVIHSLIYLTYKLVGCIENKDRLIVR